MRRISHVFLGLLAACAGATTTVEPSASADPPAAAASANSAPASIRPDAPAIAGRADEEIVLDHRGAFGPLLADQFGVDLAGPTGRCQKVPVRATVGDLAVESSASIDPAAAQQLRAFVQSLLAQPPRSARRRFMIHDFGTLTLTLRDQSRSQTLIVDGASTLDPYPQQLLALLQQLRAQCEGQPTAPQSATAPAAAGH